MMSPVSVILTTLSMHTEEQAVYLMSLSKRVSSVPGDSDSNMQTKAVHHGTELSLKRGLLAS